MIAISWTQFGAVENYNRKTVQKRILRGLKLRGFRRYQISNPNFIYQNDQRKKINTLTDFERATPTHFQKFCKKFQN